MRLKILQRLPGLFFVALGFGLYFLVIPTGTEFVDYGWMRPQTMPNMMAVLIILAGTAMSLNPPHFPEVHWPQVLWVVLYLILLSLGLAAISRFGFLPVAPLLALSIMVLIGERRIVWLTAGSLATPFIIWLFVSVLLDRPLPG